MTYLCLKIILLNKLVFPIHASIAVCPPDRITRCVGGYRGQGGGGWVGWCEGGCAALVGGGAGYYGCGACLLG